MRVVTRNETCALERFFRDSGECIHADREGARSDTGQLVRANLRGEEVRRRKGKRVWEINQNQ